MTRVVGNFLFGFAGGGIGFRAYDDRDWLMLLYLVVLAVVYFTRTVVIEDQARRNYGTTRS